MDYEIKDIIYNALMSFEKSNYTSNYFFRIDELEEKVNNILNKKDNFDTKKVSQKDINIFFKIKDYTKIDNCDTIIVDNNKYILIEELNSLCSNKKIHLTYKIDTSTNNYNYKIGKTKKNKCCHCFNKLNYNIDKSSGRIYYCYTCDKIILNYNSFIQYKNSVVYAKDIKWCHKTHSNNNICEFNLYTLQINDIRFYIDKKNDYFLVDSRFFKFCWDIDSKNKVKYVLRGGQYFNIYKNSEIKFNNISINVELEEGCRYKLSINNIPLYLDNNIYKHNLLIDK